MLTNSFAKQGIIRRAFELADTGIFFNVAELQSKLSREGYTGVEMYLQGPVLRGELRRRCKIACGYDTKPRSAVPRRAPGRRSRLGRLAQD